MRIHEQEVVTVDTKKIARTTIVVIGSVTLSICAWYYNKTKPLDGNPRREIITKCIESVNDMYIGNSSGYRAKSYFYEDEPLYTFGYSNKNGVYYLDATDAGLPEMYYEEKTDLLFFRNNGTEEWYCMESEEDLYFKNYIFERYNEFGINYLNYAKYDTIDVLETEYEGEECYDLFFRYDSTKLFDDLKEEKNESGVAKNWNLFAKLKASLDDFRETGGDYYIGHYYLKKKDMTVMFVETMIGEKYQYEKTDISIPEEVYVAPKGTAEVNY